MMNWIELLFITKQILQWLGFISVCAVATSARVNEAYNFKY